MNLLKRIFEKSEASPTPPLPPQLTPLEEAEEECLKISIERQTLLDEYSAMACRHNLLMNQFCVPVPQTGDFQTLAEVRAWWPDFCRRSNEVRSRHNQAMQKVAAARYHMGGN